MPDDPYSVLQLIKDDPRYSIDAYVFVREALAYAADALELGSLDAADTPDAEPKTDEASNASTDVGDKHVGDEPDMASSSIEDEKPASERHLTGQQLCEAIRLYALNQFGYMSQVVLGSWGVRTTSAFGDIVYNMIEAGLMKKSAQDHRSHFDEVFEFEEVFDRKFEICNAVGRPINLKGSM